VNTDAALVVFLSGRAQMKGWYHPAGRNHPPTSPDAARGVSGTLSRIAAGHPINRISELMPWAYQSPIDEIAA
jgi:hypothetical protein